MGRIFASFYDIAMRGAERVHFSAWRSALLANTCGTVLEIGAGTGANLPHYPDDVQRLVLAEPDRFMRSKLTAKLRSHREEEVIAATAEHLPLQDGSIDTVVSTLVLCSVDNLEQALHEVKRVLRPGGQLVFIEHVAARDDPTLLRWQQRISPIWQRALGNCHLARRTGQAIVDAGFEMNEAHYERLRGGPAIVGAIVRGVATSNSG